MKKLNTILLLVAFGMVFNIANVQAQEMKKKDSKTKVTADSMMLCGGCGHVKGTEACCKADATACSKCELHKGAPGCCKMEKGKDVALCSSCGQVKGADACCKEGAEKCGKCDMHKGAPGCCKVEKKG